MVLPNIGSQLNYAGNNPVFVQSVTGWAVRRSLIPRVFLGLPAGLNLRTSFLYLPIEKLRYRLAVACFKALQVPCAWLYFAKFASTKCKQDCLDVFDTLQGRYIYIYMHVYKTILAITSLLITAGKICWCVLVYSLAHILHPSLSIVMNVRLDKNYFFIC